MLENSWFNYIGDQRKNSKNETPYRCYVPTFVEIGLPVPEKRFLKGFYHIWAWWPSWSCDPHAANKIS